VSIRDLLRKHNIRLKHGLGQHFLHDEGLLDKIVRSAHITKDDLVVEIGTGVGTLTKHIAKYAGHVLSFEVDTKLIPAAKEYLKDMHNVEIINEDALKVDMKKYISKHPHYKSVKVVANLPYYITSPLIAKFLEGEKIFKTIVVTIQKEVAERICASPGNKTYGSFTIFVNYYAKPSITMMIPPAAFMPPPEVNSAVLKLDVLSEPAVNVKDEKLFFRLVHAAFVQRRKMLHNAILNANINGIDKEKLDPALAKLKIDSKRRGETLSMKEFASLADAFSS
jgi:16S rRNA (adenine1518-N6/adenine1519-N6)-dimethyltransferase